MPNDTQPTSPAADKKAPITTSTYIHADGSEADSPLDSASKLVFKLNESGREFTLDLSAIRQAASAAGVAEADINALAAYAGFGAKTKWNNIANSIRNGAKTKGTPEGSPEAQADAVQEFIDEVAKGNWRGEVGEGGIIAGTADLAEAVARFQRKNGKADATADAIKVKLEAMSKEERAKYRNDPRIAAELATLRAERATAKAQSTTEDNGALLNL